MKMKLIDKKTGEEVKNLNALLDKTGLGWCDAEDFAAMGDGTPIICNKCGGFDYLDSSRYTIIYTTI